VNLLARIALAIVIAAPLTSQIETPYFSLATTRTFGSNEEPTVNLSGLNLGAVQMRVYRVNNPIKFYTDLEDTHSFGAINPRPGAKRTWLEVIHDWKRSWRRNIRADLRGQFTESPSAHFAKPKAEPPPASTQTYFAQAPILNQEQLVLSFIQPISARESWNSVPVKIHLKESGLYLVEAVHGNLRAYT